MRQYIYKTKTNPAHANDYIMPYFNPVLANFNLIVALNDIQVNVFAMQFTIDISNESNIEQMYFFKLKVSNQNQFQRHNNMLSVELQIVSTYVHTLVYYISIYCINM